MEINLDSFKVGKATNAKYLLAAEISEYFNKGISPHFVLGWIAKIGELAVRNEFERSKNGERPISLFIWLLKQHKVEYINGNNNNN